MAPADQLGQVHAGVEAEVLKAGKAGAGVVEDRKDAHPSAPRRTFMLIRFWGVRGSIASPGPETAAVSSSDIFVFRHGAWHAIYSQHSTASS